MQRHKMQKPYGETVPTDDQFSEDCLNVNNPGGFQDLDGVVEPVSLDDMLKFILANQPSLPPLK